MKETQIVKAKHCILSLFGLDMLDFSLKFALPGRIIRYRGVKEECAESVHRL